jgi:hypothetical protein
MRRLLTAAGRQRLGGWPAASTTCYRCWNAPNLLGHGQTATAGLLHRRLPALELERATIDGPFVAGGGAAGTEPCRTC